MSALLLLFSLLFFPNAKAETLLVPDSSVSYESYSEKCRKEGYQCTQSYFAQEIAQKPTPEFDQFLDSLDLTNRKWVEALPKTIHQLLQREMISLDQLDMLIRLLEQLETQNISLLASKNFLGELKLVHQNLLSEPAVPLEESELIVFFKKPLTKTRYLKLKKSYLNLPHYEVSYNRLPKAYDFRRFVNQSSRTLVEGDCEKSVIADEIKASSAKVLSEKSCGWSKSIAQSTTSFTSTVKENKNWLLIGGLLIGAAVLANQYEVSFEF